MRPEKLAEHIGTVIRSVAEPLHRALRDQQREIQDLKHALAAVETRTKEHATTLGELRDENKALGQHIADAYRRTSGKEQPGTRH